MVESDSERARLRMPSIMASNVFIEGDPGRWDSIQEVILGILPGAVPGSINADTNMEALASVKASSSASC